MRLSHEEAHTRARDDDIAKWLQRITACEDHVPRWLLQPFSEAV